MRAYLIDPFDKTVTEVDYSGDFKDIYKFIGAACFDCARFSEHNNDAAYVDDEGLFKAGQAFFMIGEYHTPLAGKALVLGCDYESGETICAETEMSDLKVKWVSQADLMAMCG